MKLLIQRVLEAKVIIDHKCHSQIGRGLLVFLGIHHDDTEELCVKMVEKFLNLRLFPSAEDEGFHLSLLETGNAAMIVSQFTLYADCSKGRRPSFVDAARPEKALPLYEKFIEETKIRLSNVSEGVFGAHMHVHLVNDGPVTIQL